MFLYLQSSRNSHKIYQCRRCAANGVNVVNRRCRVVDHILKHHVAMDRVPFSCSLCMFRCMDQPTLLSHVSKYQRHVRLAREMGVSNHIRFLVESKNPVRISEEDMTEVSRPAFPATLEQPVDDLDSYDNGSLSGDLPTINWQDVVPTTLVPQPASSVFPVGATSAATRTFMTHSTPAMSMQPVPPTSAIQAETSNAPVKATYTATPLLALATPPSLLPLEASAAPMPQPTSSSPLANLAASTLVSPFEALFAPGRLSTTQAVPSTMPSNPPTPVLDELVLPDILCDAGYQDPLMIVAAGDGNPNEPPKKRSCLNVSTSTDEAPQQPNIDIGPIVNVMADTSRALIQAIDSNTRAVRQQEHAVREIARELAHLNRQFQRRLTPDQPVKSTIHKPRKQ